MGQAEHSAVPGDEVNPERAAAEVAHGGEVRAEHGNAPQEEPDTLLSAEDAATGSDRTDGASADGAPTDAAPPAAAPEGSR